MGILKKILGICSTPQPLNSSSWNYAMGKIEIDMNLAPELKQKGGAIRLEGKGLPGKVLVFQGDDGNYYALKNRCTHIGHRRIDPVQGKKMVKCCSVLGSTFSYEGKRISGPAKENLEPFSTSVKDTTLTVTMTA